MTRDERLKKIAADFYAAKESERQSTAESKELREEFFRLHDEVFRGKDHLLPVRTIEVPDEFFEATEMSKDDFVKSRFPGWNVEHVEYNTSMHRSIFVLKRDPKYIPGVVEFEEGGETYRVAKEVSEYTPEIDWHTLRAERPDLFEQLAQPVTAYEIDEEAFEKLVNDNPEELATIQRHMEVKAPVLRATAKKVKGD